MHPHPRATLFSAVSTLCGVFLSACVAADLDSASAPEAVGEASQAASVDVNLGSKLGDSVAQGTTCGMLNDYTPPPSCIFSATPDTAFSWTAPSSATYTFTTAGSNFDTVLHIYDGNGGNLLDCADDTGSNQYSSSVLNLTAGKALTIVVDGFNSDCGTYKLNIASSSPPSPSPSPPTAALQLWLRADAGLTSSAGKVSSWADQSGNGYNAAMNAPSQPSLVAGALNGKPVIRFDGAQSLSLNKRLQPSTFTVFVVGKNSMPSEAFSMILGPVGSSPNNQLRWENGSQALFVGTSNNLPIITSTIGNTRVYHALSARYNGSQMSVYRDGSLVSTHSFTTSGTWDLQQIGAWYAQYHMVGDIAEILFYNAAISEGDRSAVNSYLKSKYALP